MVLTFNLMINPQILSLRCVPVYVGHFRVKAPRSDTSSLPLLLPQPPGPCKWRQVGREVKACGGEKLCHLHPLHSTSVMAAGTGNQSTAALSEHTIGPAPATMNGLSDALSVASLFNDKFGNVWIFSPDLIPVQRCSRRAEKLDHKPLYLSKRWADFTHKHKLEVTS